MHDGIGDAILIGARERTVGRWDGRIGKEIASNYEMGYRGGGERVVGLCSGAREEFDEEVGGGGGGRE